MLQLAQISRPKRDDATPASSTADIMAFLAEARSTPAGTSLRADVARRPLKELAVNSTIEQSGVRKPVLRWTHPRGKGNQNERTTHQRVRELRLQPEQHHRLISIAETLQDIPRFANRVTRLHGQQSSAFSCSRVQLERPSCRIWRLLGDPTLPSLSRDSIRQLQETLIHDISGLYAKYLPYTPDLTRLEIVSKTSRGRLPRIVFRPLIDASDFDLDAAGQTTSLAELGKQRIRFVKAQFDVLEMLAKLSKPHQMMRLSVDLEPTCVAQILRTHRPPVQQQNLLIRYVKKYSSSLGQLVIETTRAHLRSLPWRMSPPAAPAQHATRDRCSTIEHTLSLIHQSLEVESECTKRRRLQKDRASLLVVLAVLLIHQHAKVVEVLASGGLLEHGSKDTPDLYDSHVIFDSVVRARQLAKEALDDLSKQGIELDQEINCLVQAEG